MYLNEMSCCGAREMHELKFTSPKTAVKEVVLDKFREGENFSVCIFTGTARAKYGKSLASYIKEHNLGTVVKVGPIKNPNSGNMIEVWTWAINSRKLKAWARTNEIDTTSRPYYGCSWQS